MYGVTEMRKTKLLCQEKSSNYQMSYHGWTISKPGGVCHPGKVKKRTFSSTGVKPTTHPYCCLCQIGFQLPDMHKLSFDDFCTLYHRKLSILSCRVVITISSILLLTGLGEQTLCPHSIFILLSERWQTTGGNIFTLWYHVLTCTHMKSSTALLHNCLFLLHPMDII